MRFARFLVVGAMNTLFGLGLYAMLVWLGLPVWAALMLGHVSGVIFNFFTTGHFVFSDVAASRLPRFVGAYIGCYLLNYIALRGLMAAHAGPIAGQIILTPLMAAISFFVMSRFVFRPS